MSQQTISLTAESDWELPIVDLLTGRTFITGKSGSGKSNTASVMVEELLAEGYPVFIVDTDGEYWGLKQDYEILHVGGDEECDLQVGPEHAEKLAELALNENIPIILDISGYLDEDESDEIVRKAAKHLFAKEKKLQKPFLLIVEEAHEYIPEDGSVSETGKMLIKIGKRGRKHGLGLAGVSQRPADVKKDFISQCDLIFWHRLTWDNDRKVVRRVINRETADEIKTLDDGEAFVTGDDEESHVQRVQIRKKRTHDAGATPDLGGVERPDLKSVSGDLVDELEEISDREAQRQDEIARLESQNEDLRDKIDELERELEEARDLKQMADQFAEAMQARGEGDNGSGSEVDVQISEVVEERNQLRSELESRENEIEELEAEIAELREAKQELDRIQSIDFETIDEAITRLTDELGLESDTEDTEKWKRKYKKEQQRRQEIEEQLNGTETGSNPDEGELDSDPLENQKVKSVVQDVKSTLSNLGEKERQMLRYYLVSGPCSQKAAYKYAGGSPTSGAKSVKTKTLRDAGLVQKIGRGEYDFALRNHLDDVLGGFTSDELDRVYDNLETEVYNHVMEENDAK